MQRREFLETAAGLASAAMATQGRSAFGADAAKADRRVYATPADAMRSPRETEVFVTALVVGIDDKRPDYLATVDVDPTSPSYSKVVARLPMREPGDELHHFGWNACSSCHADPSRARRYLIVPGFRSGRIHVIDAADPRHPKLEKVIEAEAIAKRAT